ncbi:MAG: hypothetical protein M3Z67_08675 [Commensalibacter sp.]|nr:hypothetical protein [Commensalibacter sp.]
MPSDIPINMDIISVPAHTIECGNTILYLDQLWKITRIEYSVYDPFIRFQAIREVNKPDTSITGSFHSERDNLNFSRLPEVPMTIVQELSTPSSDQE